MNRFTKLMALACMTLSFTALAQRRDDPASRLVDRFADAYSQVRSMAYRLDSNSIDSLNRQLDEVNRILNSRTGPSTGDLRCVSKDDDGRDPWVIGVATDPVTVVKIPNTVIGKAADCQNAISQIRMIDFDSGYVCVSKDNDGRDPWALASLSLSQRSARPIQNSVTANFATCSQQMNDLKWSASGAYFCGTKDNDGRAPFLKVLVRTDGTVTVGTQTYNDYASCNSAP